MSDTSTGMTGAPPDHPGPRARYEWRDQPFDPDAAEALRAALGIPAAAARLLASRGVADPEAARRFLRPALRDLGDPFAFPSMRAAAERIAAAIAAGERIVVYGDFDADGVGACAILCGVMERLGADCSAFIPRRMDEGYGLSHEGWERCKAENPGVRLVVTVDCGITNVAEVAMVLSEGVGIVVTDHHTPGSELPAGCVTVNPRLGATPGAESLCGAGVAFKLAHALVKLDMVRRGLSAPAVDLREWLDIAAISTIADVVPLTGENRILAASGLNRLRNSPSRGLFALMDVANLQREEIGGSNVAFRICPRINAAGRMGSAADAYELLRTADGDRARELAARLNGRNAERHSAEQDVFDDALASLAESGFDETRDGAVVVAGGPDWHPGVLGIVAARLAARFNRPAAAVSFNPDGTGRGSMRAGEAGDYDVNAAMGACAKFLRRFGGHRKAGGFSVDIEYFPAFRAAMSEACRAQAGGRVSCVPELGIDLWLDPGEATIETVEAVAAFEPFGEGNREPVFALRGLRLAAPPRAVGAERQHVQAPFKCGGMVLGAIGFSMGERIGELSVGAAYDIAGSLQTNTFCGETRLQMVLKDFRPA